MAPWNSAPAMWSAMNNIAGIVRRDGSLPPLARDGRFRAAAAGLRRTRKIDHVARRRGVKISGKWHQDKEQVEDKVREAGESDFEPGRTGGNGGGGQCQCHPVRKPSPQEWSIRRSGAGGDRAEGVARCPGDGPTERDCDESECGDEPMHRLCDAVVGRRSARRGGAGRLRSWHGS